MMRPGGGCGANITIYLLFVLYWMTFENLKWIFNLINFTIYIIYKFEMNTSILLYFIFLFFNELFSFEIINFVLVLVRIKHNPGDINSSGSYISYTDVPKQICFLHTSAYVFFIFYTRIKLSMIRNEKLPVNVLCVHAIISATGKSIWRRNRTYARWSSSRYIRVHIQNYSK